MADRVAVMRAGRLEQCAAPAQLYDRPATAFVAEFVGTMNRLRGTMIDADLVEVAGRRLPVDGGRPVPGTKVHVLLRPEAIELEAVADDAAADPAVGVVRTATFLGAVTRVAIALEDGTHVKADLPSHRASEFPAGGRARLTPAARPVLVVEPDGMN